MNHMRDETTIVNAKPKSGRYLMRRIQVTAVKHPMGCVLAAWVTSTILALSLTAIMGVPAPRVHDEYAYLLGADTLASGRLTNPTHPMWQHFESFHIFHQPSYTCKYPPAQALTLAIGQTIGHPIIGSCLATGAATAALVWMLLGWLPRRYGPIAALFAVLHPSIQVVWGQSYWGGAVGLCGGALLLGSFARLSSQMKLRHGFVAALAIVMLANSRPFEGAVLTISVAMLVLWKLFTQPDWKWGAFALRIAAPLVAVLVLAAASMWSYNRAVTGDGLTMPYQLHEQVYGWNPLFLWQQPGPKPSYRHSIIERFYELDRANNAVKFQSFSRALAVKLSVATYIFNFFCGTALMIGILGVPMLLKKSRYRYALLALIPGFLASMMSFWGWPHYAAPVAPLLILFALAGAIELWRRSANQAGIRLAMLATIFMLGGTTWVATLASHQKMSHQSWARHRATIEQQLQQSPGRDLVLVRYADSHITHNEWVYNRANIDEANVIWAREISAARREALLEYFSDRKVWIVDADDEHPKPRPLSPSPNFNVANRSQN